jgi:NADH-quinone oxidoreductase subunit N
MVTGLYEQLQLNRMSLPLFIPELILILGIVFVIALGLVKKKGSRFFSLVALLVFSLSISVTIFSWRLYSVPVDIFNGMLRTDDFSAYLKIVIDAAALLTVLMTWRNSKQLRLPEYYALLVAAVLGAHMLVMSMNLVTIFISLEMISLASYVLAGFSFSRAGAEGSLKYFLFGSVASALMLYGFTFLYGITGTLNFSSPEFVNGIINKTSSLFFVAGIMAMAGFFYKIAAAPLHPWAPDVYEAAPMPIVAFFSVVPKLAGIGIFAGTQFIWAIAV